MRIYALFLSLAGLLFYACNSGSKAAVVPDYYVGLYIKRTAKDERMLNDGIIGQEKKKDFKGLNYFEPDSTYRVKAGIKWLEKEKVIFRTNSERSPVYYKFCLLKFRIGDSVCHLTAYSEDTNAQAGLFIPFKDLSSNKETYGGGRYIEMPYKGEKQILTLDFNEAFNPYCHYNHSYSCPLVPAENTLQVAIYAGEKKLYD